jgi:hypothetical protein
MPEGVTTWHDIYWLEKDLEFAAIRMRDQAVDNDAAHMENSLEIITKAILLHYDDIDDLTLDLGVHGFSRLVQKGWGTYLAMGDESAWYANRSQRKEALAIGAVAAMNHPSSGRASRAARSAAVRDLAFA